MHPRTPLTLGRDLVPRLFWRDLQEVSLAPHAQPVLRRAAERRLGDRVESMALGERIALARRAGRALIDTLCGSDEEPVLRALLGNPRMIEAEAVRIASSEAAPSALLGHLARHHRWGRRREIRLALARNARTPVAAALAILQDSATADLRRLCDDAALPRIVRVAAERELEARADARARAGSASGRRGA
jgi:hypothetical protein